MRTLTDTWTMTKRSLRHTTRSVDTIITVVLIVAAVVVAVGSTYQVVLTGDSGARSVWGSGS